jgi:hypothetical protein
MLALGELHTPGDIQLIRIETDHKPILQDDSLPAKIFETTHRVQADSSFGIRVVKVNVDAWHRNSLLVLRRIRDRRFQDLVHLLGCEACHSCVVGARSTGRHNVASGSSDVANRAAAYLSVA